MYLMLDEVPEVPVVQQGPSTKQRVDSFRGLRIGFRVQGVGFLISNAQDAYRRPSSAEYRNPPKTRASALSSLNISSSWLT